MAVLARCDQERLEQAWSELDESPRYVFLRRPESGLVMVRGRAGGSGAPFNLGEAAVTRCVVRLADGGPVGVAYVAGRSGRKAELAAVFDALLQDDRRGREVAQRLIDSAAVSQDQRRRLDGERVASTKVEFFTMVRGED